MKFITKKNYKFLHIFWIHSIVEKCSFLCKNWYSSHRYCKNNVRFSFSVPKNHYIQHVSWRNMKINPKKSISYENLLWKVWKPFFENSVGGDGLTSRNQRPFQAQGTETKADWLVSRLAHDKTSNLTQYYLWIKNTEFYWKRCTFLNYRGSNFDKITKHRM